MAEKEPSFEEAVANDWKNAYERDIATMSPVQKFALKQAWDAVETKNTDTSQQDFERKVARMSNSEFNRLSQDLAYDAQRKASEKK